MSFILRLVDGDRDGDDGEDEQDASDDDGSEGALDAEEENGDDDAEEENEDDAEEGVALDSYRGAGLLENEDNDFIDADEDVEDDCGDEESNNESDHSAGKNRGSGRHYKAQTVKMNSRESGRPRRSHLSARVDSDCDDNGDEGGYDEGFSRPSRGQRKLACDSDDD